MNKKKELRTFKLTLLAADAFVLFMNWPVLSNWRAIKNSSHVDKPSDLVE